MTFAGCPSSSGLRIRKLSNTEVYSLTWNFASADERATFHLGKSDGGEPLVVWRRVGDHSVYERP